MITVKHLTLLKFYNRTRAHSSLDYLSPLNFQFKLNYPCLTVRGNGGAQSFGSVLLTIIEMLERRFESASPLRDNAGLVNRFAR